MKKLAIEKFKNNEDNFFKMFQKFIIDDESSFDQTTTIKGYFNNDKNGYIYFRFEIETERTHFLTDYYRYDYDFEEGNTNNLDELDSIFDDIEILSFFGDEISNQNYI